MGVDISINLPLDAFDIFGPIGLPLRSKSHDRLSIRGGAEQPQSPYGSVRPYNAVRGKLQPRP